ncbi:hypothetical protein GCM10010969_35090 [Saccharibacillus kuerlensis]|uniref:Uncharacterized protein n=1 Tax=Saccharibacillus kuerlensis TaxID=459527 RepID=A0ABQ2L8T9_9BACL|nr:hypothetical protein GCM10010969_35090 [Saccharibacillus kuerlensis]
MKTAATAAPRVMTFIHTNEEEHYAGKRIHFQFEKKEAFRFNGLARNDGSAVGLRFAKRRDY